VKIFKDAVSAEKKKRMIIGKIIIDFRSSRAIKNKANLHAIHHHG
jgi:hypothetical protein